MSQNNLVKLECTKCKRVTHFTTRNKKTLEKKLELKKFCKFCRGHQLHKEGKKK